MAKVATDVRGNFKLEAWREGVSTRPVGAQIEHGDLDVVRAERGLLLGSCLMD
jgi:hypothetical protein